jgi:hypothetical protein
MAKPVEKMPSNMAWARNAMTDVHVRRVCGDVSAMRARFAAMVTWCLKLKKSFEVFFVTVFAVLLPAICMLAKEKPMPMWARAKQRLPY